MRKLTGKVVVITGAGDGIGKELAKLYLAQGAIVVVNDICDQKLENFKNSQTFSINNFYCFRTDISRKEEVIHFSEFVKNKCGHVDILINNAGVSIGRLDAVEISDELNDRIFGVNYWGNIYCIRSFLPLIPNNSGSKIVNVCSLFSYLSAYHRSAYCASKSALMSFSNSLRVELKRYGIKVITVFPGMVNTQIVHNSIGWKNTKDKLAAEEILYKFASLSSSKAANKIFVGIARNKKQIRVGIDAKLIFHFLRLFPQWGEELINSWMMFSEERFMKKSAQS